MNKPIKANILKVYGREPETLDELAQCVIHMINSQENSNIFERHKSSQPKFYKVVGFVWDIAYGGMISNSHSSPEGYPQNWGREDNVPKGYPGWSGRVWIRYADECRDFGSTPFSKTLTHTGAGGLSSFDCPWEGISTARFKCYSQNRMPKEYPEPKCYSWDYRFYELDWPLLAHWVEKQKIWGVLNGQGWNPRHKFEWTDPNVLAKDLAFIAECATIKSKETV